MPVITGDCVSPVLARVCGMHLGYYHVVANWGTGLEPEDPTLILDRLYMQTLPGLAAALELAFLDGAAEPTTCRCRELLRPRNPDLAAHVGLEWSELRRRSCGSLCSAQSLR
jgi:hypothetical protein